MFYCRYTHIFINIFLIKNMSGLDKIKCKNFNFPQRISPSTTPSSIFYTPSQILTAYGINLIVPPGNKPRGYGIKIAIISCYHYSNIQSDLNKYCSKYSLQPLTLNIINQAGNLSNNNWALEICLNTQIINTLVPGATVYVIESKSNTFNDIKTAITTAVNLGVNIISMSFGTMEFATQSSLESLFMNSNITFLASSGDNDIVSYPASSGNVLAIGGTKLLLTSSNTRQSETLWGDAGAGTSLYTPRPSYQSEVNSGTKRNIPDLALIADTTTGFNVYCSINGGYFGVGGTSLSCPLMAGYVAILNQYRKSANKPFLNSISTSTNCIQKILYQSIYTNVNLKPSLYDVTSGTDNDFNPDVGYDIASGLGSIVGNLMYSAFTSLA